MKKLLLATAIVSTMSVGAFAQSTGEMIIAGASESGGYYRAAQVAAERLNQDGYSASVVSTAGSMEIAKGVCNGDFSAGYMQEDAIYQMSRNGCNIIGLSTYGEGEYAMMFVPGDSDVGSLSDLGSGDSVLVGGVGSGSELFLSTIKQIEAEYGNGSDWANVSAVTKPYEMADALAAQDRVDAVLIVATPSYPYIQSLLDLGWKSIDVYDKDINDMKFGKSPLYEPSSTNVDGGWGSEDSYRVDSYGAALERLVNSDDDLYLDLTNALSTK